MFQIKYMIFKSNFFFEFLIHFLLVKVWKSFLLYYFIKFDYLYSIKFEYKFYIFLLLLLFKFCNIITIYHDLLSLSKIIAFVIFFSLLTPRFYNIHVKHRNLILDTHCFAFLLSLDFSSFSKEILHISDYSIDYQFFNVYSAAGLLRIYSCNAEIHGEFIN